MNGPNFVTPGKTHSVPFPKNGLYVGVVTLIEGNKIYVELPKVTPGFSYGPCLVLANNLSVTVTKQDALTDVSASTGSAVTSVSGGEATSFGTFVTGISETSDEFVTDVEVERVVPPVGSKVLCGFLDNSLDEVIVLGSIL